MSEPVSNPRVGMMATVRNRRGLVVSVDPFDALPEGRLHLVRVEYTDPDGVPDAPLLWDRKHNRPLLEPTALPRIADQPPSFPRPTGLERMVIEIRLGRS